MERFVATVARLLESAKGGRHVTAIVLIDPHTARARLWP
jgi:hypothetical protein